DYDENIIITDADWSSEILYYSNRKGLMLREDMQIDEGEIRDNNFKLIAAKNPKLYPLLFTSFEDVAFIKEVSGFNIYAIDPGRGIDLADIENEQENAADRAIEYDVSEKAQAYIDRIVQNPIPGIAVEIDGWGFIEGSKADYQSIILEFKNTQKSYFFKATKVERKDVGEHFQDDEYNYSGFNCLIRDAEELTGEYKVNIIINDGEKYYTSNQQFDVIIN
ncbi:MAG: hypothetical protein K0Q87_3187, partial [Neobacillus sp.]|nr:hypothetical protein [Neobacillus sp.]